MPLRGKLSGTAQGAVGIWQREGQGNQGQLSADFAARENHLANAELRDPGLVG